MREFLANLFDASDFTPRAASEGWYPELMWLHNVSDALIWVAYLAIPGVLVYFVRRRRDVPFPHMFWLFGAFIISCGFTHFLEVHTFYFPMYRLSGLVKAVTALVSWITVLALIPVTPRVLSMRFPEELEKEIAERKRAQESLSRSEEGLRKQTRVLRSILDSMSDAVVVADESGSILLTNPAAKRLLGSYTESMLFENEPACIGAFLPDGVTRYPANDLPLSRAIRGETVNRAEVFVRHSGATQGLCLSVNGRPLKDEEGVVKGGVIVLRDVTERRQAEDEIRRKQKQLADAQQLARLGSWEWDVATNRVLWSDELYRLFGRDPQEFETTYKDLIQRVHPEDRQPLAEIIEKAYRTGQPFEHDVRVTAPDGTTRTLHSRGQVLVGEADRPLRLLGTCQDVTQAREREEALRQTHQALRALLEASPVAIYALDLDGKVQRLWNRAAEHIFGWKEEEVLGRLLPMVPDEETTRWQQLLRSAAQGEGVTDVELRRRRRDESYIDVSLSMAPLYDADGRVDGIMVVAADITARKLAARALRESELLFRSVWESSADAMRLTDRQGTIVAVNGAYAQLVGVETADLVGQTLAASHAAGVDQQRVLSKYKRRFEEGRFDERIEKRLTVRSGTTLDLEIAQSLIRFESREPLLLSVFRDVTEKKQVEQQVRRSRALLARAQQIAHVGSWEWEVDSNKITWSDELYRIFGLARAQFDGTFEAFLGCFHPEDRARVKGLIEAACRDRTSFQFDERILRPEGAVRTLHAQGEVIAEDNGRVVRLIGTCQDITEATQREAALRESEERFRLLIEGVKDYAVFMLDPQGYLVSWNTGAERIKGYSPGEIIGRHFSCFYLPQDIEDGKPARHLEQAAEEGKCEDEGWRVRKDGSLFWVNTVLTALWEEGGRLRGFAKITRDTTELKQAHERALRAERLAAIGEMITGLAHESRNALQRTQACLERLAWKVEDRPDAAELVARIRQAQRDLHHTFEDVRQYAAPVTLNREQCDLGSLFDETWEELADARGGRRTSLRKLPPECDLLCKVDAFAIKQVLRNTLENALAACPDPVEICARFSETTLDGANAVEMSIRDNGPGFTAEQTQRIFEPFYTTKTRGTGLGMAIAKRVVEAHGGRIAVGSGDSRGAEVRITLPRRHS